MADIKQVDGLALRARALELFEYDRNAGTFRYKSTSGKAMSGDVAGTTKSRKGYRSIRIDGHSYRAHRLVWIMHYDEWPLVWVDHINGDRDDNRIDNLRLATPAQSSGNMVKKVSASKVLKGASYRPQTGRWRSSIKIGGRNTHLGIFDTEQEAHEAYRDASLRIHGEFSVFARAALNPKAPS